MFPGEDCTLVHDKSNVKVLGSVAVAEACVGSVLTISTRAPGQWLAVMGGQGWTHGDVVTCVSLCCRAAWRVWWEFSAI